MHRFPLLYMHFMSDSAAFALLYRLLGPELGADFDFLKGCRGAAVPKESH